MNLIKKFQKLLVKNNIDAYIIPTSDYHNSEYISDYFKARKYLSGFTGSAATLIILQESAYIWVDGRYFIQAEQELEGSNIQIMKIGQPNVPTIIEFLNATLHENSTLGFDARVMNTKFVLDLMNKLTKNISLVTAKDLISEIWNNRPSLPFSMLYKYEEFFCGASYLEKLAQIKEKMQAHNANAHIICALEDQAWLYNLRANDIAHTPVFLAFTVIDDEDVYLFINPDKLDLSTSKYLDDNKIIVKPYNSIYDFLGSYKNKSILVDFNKINYNIYNSIYKNNKIINSTDPTIALKSIKNECEIRNTKLAHIKDGAAFTKFMYFVKSSYMNNIEISELSASEFLKSKRAEQAGFIDISFNTICGFKDHGAMMHYSATNESNYKINEPGFLLVDSGGHYLEGTTDITRTIAIGEVTDEMKFHFTTVLKSVIDLSEAVFLKGCRGVNLDILARGPIWKLLLDYKCGTGHGVGHLLSVHEAPNGFRWQIVPERSDSAVLLPGMITTNEPGIYLEGKYGIRIENELLCVENGKSEFGEFLSFETITFAPIDLDAIEVNLLSENQKAWLNNYHALVFEKLSPYLNEDEISWLKYYTREI